jgi:hypothetical protein
MSLKRCSRPRARKTERYASALRYRRRESRSSNYIQGIVTRREAAEKSDRLRSDPSFDPQFSELIDLNGVSEIQMNYADFRSQQEMNPFSASSKRAFVVTSPNSVFGTARMYQIMRSEDACRSEDVCVGVFKSVEDAMRWLGTTEPSADTRRPP